MFSYKVYQVQQPITVDAVSSIMLTKECTQTCTVMPWTADRYAANEKISYPALTTGSSSVSNRMNLLFQK